MPCPGGCQVLKYLGESHLEGRHVGQCFTCGGVRHGYKCNWRPSFKKDKGLVLLPIKDPGVKKRARKTGDFVQPRHDDDLIRKLSGDGMDLDRAILLLREKGYVFK